MNPTKLITTYSKSLFQSSKNSSPVIGFFNQYNAKTLEASKESSNISEITSSEQASNLDVIRPTATIYVLGEELILIRTALMSSTILKEFFQNPTYAEKLKLDLLLLLFPGLTGIMKSFLKILAERSHLSLLPNICEEYTLILLKFKKATKVKLVIGSLLQERYGMLLLTTLKNLTASKEILLSISYNPKLLGGLTLEYNSTLIDATVLNEFSLFFTEG